MARFHGIIRFYWGMFSPSPNTPPIQVQSWHVRVDISRYLRTSLHGFQSSGNHVVTVLSRTWTTTIGVNWGLGGVYFPEQFHNSPPPRSKTQVYSFSTDYTLKLYNFLSEKIIRFNILPFNSARGAFMRCAVLIHDYERLRYGIGSFRF